MCFCVQTPFRFLILVTAPTTTYDHDHDDDYYYWYYYYDDDDCYSYYQLLPFALHFDGERKEAGNAPPTAGCKSMPKAVLSGKATGPKPKPSTWTLDSRGCSP